MDLSLAAVPNILFFVLLVTIVSCVLLTVKKRGRRVRWIFAACALAAACAMTWYCLPTRLRLPEAGAYISVVIRDGDSVEQRFYDPARAGFSDFSAVPADERPAETLIDDAESFQLLYAPLDGARVTRAWENFHGPRGGESLWFRGSYESKDGFTVVDLLLPPQADAGKLQLYVAKNGLSYHAAYTVRDSAALADALRAAAESINNT